MKLLALDTAMGACSVAVHDAGHVRAKAFAAMERGHAEAIAPMVRDVMAEARLEFVDLERIVVTVGPGTFTGVRIGLAMARGLGLALEIPVIGVDTLAAIAANGSAIHKPLLVAADARKGEIYAALFDQSGKNPGGPAVTSIDTCLRLLPEGPVQVRGTAADSVIAASTRHDLTRSRCGDVPDAASFGRHGFDLPDTGTMPAPLYLRAPDAKPQGNAATADVRAATAAEAGVFAALHAECFGNPWCAEEFAKLMAMPGARPALLLDAGEPAGFILTRLAADEAEIVTIGTRPSAQRRGFARMLMDALLRDLPASGIKSCFIEVAPSNSAARALYASCGFTQAGMRRGYYEGAGGVREDAIVMRKELVP
jgi:tRNA threonylcarbamoyladenosine biosynthesis protein TsaB